MTNNADNDRFVGRQGLLLRGLIGNYALGGCIRGGFDAGQKGDIEEESKGFGFTLDSSKLVLERRVLSRQAEELKHGPLLRRTCFPHCLRCDSRRLSRK